jgi:hypothetical protein
MKLLFMPPNEWVNIIVFIVILAVILIGFLYVIEKTTNVASDEIVDDIKQHSNQQ